ncbi:MAG TPA: VOC family protein [Candidatus Acidoferrales bacterium]|nr:VOC family protein [Candidatus Acidoferrales bacterium]
MNTVDLIIFPANDLEKTKKFFTTLLGTEPYVDGKPYVGFKVGEMEIGLVPNSPQRSMSGALAYVNVPDIKAALESLLAAGAEKGQDVTDVGYGLLVASVKDANGTPIGLRQKPNG